MDIAVTKMSDEEEQNSCENFNTSWLLEAIDHIDNVRRHLNDGKNLEPPQIRNALLDLHEMAIDATNNNGAPQELLELANDLDIRVSEMIEELSFVQNTIDKLLDLDPESSN